LLENDSTGVNVKDLKEVKSHLRRKSLC
jgi:hypothetical protein